MLATFLMAFPALLSIVSPLTGGFIFAEATADRTHAERVRLARRVGFYSFLVMMVSLWAGSYILAAFGITLAALRIAGGLVLTSFAWELLNAPERREERKQEQVSKADMGGADDVAFFPLTLPFTTGPGTIAVSVALGAGHPSATPALLGFLAGATAAALAMAVTITLIYSNADRLGQMLGQTASRTVTRLSAFLLLCIGVQILVTGVTDVLTPSLAR